MIRRLTFNGTPEHRLYFRLLFEAFRSRGSAPPDKRVTREDKRSEADILRGLKVISDPVGDDPKEGELDGRMRQLRASGGTLDLKQPEFSRLQKFLDDCQWMSGITDVAEDLSDWFDAASKIEPGSKDFDPASAIADMGKRPHRVKAS